MTWAGKRRLVYLGGLFIFIALIVFLILYPIIFKEPACNDGKMNGTETGIDCGGSCSLMCKVDVSDPVVLWSRAFHVTSSAYNLVAFVENPNVNSAMKSVSYEFRVYDTDNKMIGRREGFTFIPPNQQFAILEPRFNAGNSEVKSVLFQFTGDLVWYKKIPVINTLPIFVDNINFISDRNSSYLTARMNNESIYDLPEFDAIAIFYDSNHNAINASKTHRDGLATNSTVNLSFTWPKGFTEEPSFYDVIPLINPFITSF